MRPGRPLRADLATFCEEAWPRLVSVMSLVVGDRDRAEDIAQEALLRVCLHWSTVCRADDSSAWLYRVALNLTKSHFRRMKRHTRAMQRLRVDATWTMDTADAADAVAIRAALMKLPRRQREAVVLRYYAELSVKEAAVLLGCPEGTVKTLTSRAVDALRRQGLVEADPATKVTCDD